jgi:hypothetical protein
MAVNFAQNRGDDASPTEVSWVSSTLGSASALLSGDSTGSTGSSVPVYAVEVPGHFIALGAHVPEGSRAPSGTTLWFVASQSDWEVLGWGIANEVIPLDSLGAVETDSVTGMTATGATAWRLKPVMRSYLPQRQRYFD